MSFEEVAAGGSGFLAAGWQIAGESDVCLLLVTCAVPPSPCPGDFGTPQPGNANEFMIGLFGVTLQGPNTIEFDGVYDNGTFNHGFAFVYYSFTDDFSIRGVFGNRLPPPPANSVGVFLNRPVPEPGTALLLAAGLIALAARRFEQT